MRGQSTLDFSIRGDELEHDRVRLEQNLYDDISIHLSSTDDHDDRQRNSDADDHSTIEYPRRNSLPERFHDFASFEYGRSPDDFDAEGTSAINAWSYRNGGDGADEGISRFAGETLSTAVHHASGLTLTAGLTGRGGRRDPSISGAEYDPERQVPDMIAGIDSRFSAFGHDASRSKGAVAGVDFDPLIVDVDNSAELDHVLRQGHKLYDAHDLRSPPAHSSSGSDSDTPSNASFAYNGKLETSFNHSTMRPKLSDALLQSVTFSPKRPRSPHVNYQRSPRAHTNYGDRKAVTASPLSDTTPKAMRRQPMHNPKVQVQPPTPSRSSGIGSEFTRKAKGLKKEIDEEARLYATQKAKDQEHKASALTEREQRHHHRTTAMKSRADGYPSKNKADTFGPRSAFAFSNTKSPKRVSVYAPNASVAYPADTTGLRLPDVTGLTSAIASPARATWARYAYEGDDSPSEGEERVLATLTAVQSKLLYLENENSISRRRVRELEAELDLCRHEVERERARVQRRDQMLADAEKQRYTAEREWAKYQKEEKDKARKGKGKQKDSGDMEKAAQRYREALEEKKSLEALVENLRSHLTRLTAQLSSNQELLEELRKLRRDDFQQMRDKVADVDKLKVQVERLQGEVETLRDVVEEGLRARQETSASRSSLLSDDDDNDNDSEFDLSDGSDNGHDVEDEVSTPPLSEDEVVDEPSVVAHPTESRRPGSHDKTIRTDRATIGGRSSGPPSPKSDTVLRQTTAPGIVRESLLEREERSFERNQSRVSASPPSIVLSFARSSTPPPARHRRRQARTTEKDDEQLAEPTSPRLKPSIPANDPLLTGPSRPIAPAFAIRRDDLPIESEAPFPQIRSERLQRLFHMAPEHDAKTCVNCGHRRRTHVQSTSNPTNWLRGSLGQRPVLSRSRRSDNDGNENDDEGFEDGPSDAERDAVAQVLRQVKSTGSIPIPPQAILSRVLRDLEQEFAHFKSKYTELADAYKLMDPATNVAKRNLLARELQRIIDIMEEKGDNIAALYSLLEFKGQPVASANRVQRPVTG